MKTVIFKIIAHDNSQFSAGYHCTKAGDQSGEYVRSGYVIALMIAANRAVQAMGESNCDSIAQDNLREAIKKVDTD